MTDYLALLTSMLAPALPVLATAFTVAGLVDLLGAAAVGVYVAVRRIATRKEQA